MTEQFAGSLYFTRNGWIVHRNGVASEHLNNLHTRDISLSIPEVDHMRERDALLVFHLALIDFLVVPYAEYALVDLEQKLGFRRIIDCHSRPFCLTFLII